MLTKSWSATIKEIDAISIIIEVNPSKKGEDRLQIIGLPDAAIRESKSRVQTAIENSGFEAPHGEVIISLSPADVKKQGSSFDLPIALALIGAKDNGGITQENLSGVLAVGELRLDGSVQPIKGALPIAIHAKKRKAKALILPYANAKEAAVVAGLNVFGVKSLAEAKAIVTHFETASPMATIPMESLYEKQKDSRDFLDVKGQLFAKRGMEIAAAGFHNMILVGAPGCGKSMLAKRLPTILPPLSFDEAIETTRIHSIGGLLSNNTPFITQRPFRDPHHTISDVGLLGGGSQVKPGEVTYCHNGVLFLDELPEFKRTALEVMRQPLENGSVTISRASGSATFPARFMLIAAMNPCPCGFYGSHRNQCSCTSHQVMNYRSKISGPLMDRIDLHINVPELSESELTSERSGESSADIYRRVEIARQAQEKRFSGSSSNYNAQMESKDLDTHCHLEKETMELLKQAIYSLKLSARAYDRILRVARTIADLAESEAIESEHIAEAIQFRTFDRQM